MALHIEDPEMEKIVRELASLTRETVIVAIRRPAGERLHRLRRGVGERSLAAELLENR